MGPSRPVSEGTKPGYLNLHSRYTRLLLTRVNHASGVAIEKSKLLPREETRLRLGSVSDRASHPIVLVLVLRLEILVL